MFFPPLIRKPTRTAIRINPIPSAKTFQSGWEKMLKPTCWVLKRPFKARIRPVPVKSTMINSLRLRGIESFFMIVHPTFVFRKSISKNRLSCKNNAVVINYLLSFGGVVHLEERLTGSQKVGGSNPPVSTIRFLFSLLYLKNAL